MSARALAIYRLAAVLLLLLAGAELVACSLISPAGCELAGSSDSSGDGCLCCCRHIVVVPRIALEPAVACVVAPPPTLTAQTLTVPNYIDHPPRA